MSGGKGRLVFSFSSHQQTRNKHDIMKRNAFGITLGETYTDRWTSISGVATSLVIPSFGAPFIQLEYHHGDEPRELCLNSERLLNCQLMPAQVTELPTYDADTLYREILGVTLGVAYKDTVNGFTGIAVNYAIHLTGCDRVLLEAADSRGKLQERWFDVSRLKPVEESVTPPPQSETPGFTKDFRVR